MLFAVSVSLIYAALCFNPVKAFCIPASELQLRGGEEEDTDHFTRDKHGPGNPYLFLTDYFCFINFAISATRAGTTGSAGSEYVAVFFLTSADDSFKI